MSLRCMSWVFTDSAADGFDRLVLLAIADEADDEGGNAFPSQQRIAEKAHVSKRTVQRSIAQLETDGELLVDRPEEKGRGRVWTYTVVMGRDPVALKERFSARLFSVDNRGSRSGQGGDQVRAGGETSLTTEKRTATKGAERRAVLPKSRPTLNPVILNSERTAEAAAELRRRNALPPCEAGCVSGWILGEDNHAEPCPRCGQDAQETA